MAKITLKQAVAMTSRYRFNKKSILGPGTDPHVLPFCETLDKDEVINLLSQPGASYLRIYYGMKEDSFNVHSLMVAADENQVDILHLGALDSTAPGDDGDILDETVRCPPICPPASALNAD